MQFKRGTVDHGCDNHSRVYKDLDSGAQLHACPIKYPGEKVPLPYPGIHSASGGRLQHNGGQLVTYKLPEKTNNSSAFPLCSSETNSTSWLSRSAGVLE